MDKTAIKQRAVRKLKICAIISLGLLTLYIVSELLRIYQVRRDLSSPLVPEAVVQQISQLYFQHAIVSFIMLLIALGIFLLKRYWYTILLVVITLVGNQYLSWT